MIDTGLRSAAREGSRTIRRRDRACMDLAPLADCRAPAGSQTMTADEPEFPSWRYGGGPWHLDPALAIEKRPGKPYPS